MNNNGFVNRKVNGVYDEFLIIREHYNPNPFAIRFTRQKQYDGYIRESGISLGPVEAILKPEHWITLPHGYYDGNAIEGPEIFSVTTNFGDDRGKGNKLPSLPVVDPRFQK